MRPVSHLGFGDRGDAVSADLGTGDTRQPARRGLCRSDGGSDGHSAHYESGAKSGDGWAYRGAEHGLRSSCENCTMQFCRIYPRIVPNPGNSQFAVAMSLTGRCRLATQTKVWRNFRSAARVCGADRRTSAYGGKRTGCFARRCVVKADLRSCGVGRPRCALTCRLGTVDNGPTAAVHQA